MEPVSFGQRLKRIMKKILLYALLIAIAIACYLYWGTYEKGVKAGKILQISEKGMVFKTFEGKINLETFGALKGASPIAESFDFSVESDQEDLIKQLETVALSGERVNLVFIKRYIKVPWRGDTKYFVVRVERTAPATPVPPAD
jgi:hypothetical protein